MQAKKQCLYPQQTDSYNDIRTASSVTTFKDLLKTHLFIQSNYST